MNTITQNRCKPHMDVNENQQENRRFFRPNADIMEKEDQYVMMLDMPGTREDAIDIDLNQGLMTIHAEVEPREENAREYIMRQYETGDYRRTFRIDERIDASGISAQYTDGVLTVTMPKAEKLMPRKVQVSTS